MNITTIKTGSLSTLLIVLLLATQVSLAHAVSFTPIGSQMGLGASGTDVTNLQTFLASDSHIYPADLITGYYGSLTMAAVQQFQLSYNISATGYVGPLTLAKINSVIAAGYGIDIYAPIISNVSVDKSATSATIAWTTNETANGRVYYSTSPFTTAEAAESFQGPTILGGASVSAVNMQSIQSVNISNLQPSTAYYYIVEAQDASGNVSVTNQVAFVTAPY